MHQCPQGHPTSPGAAFCSVCGVSVEPEVTLRGSASSRSNQPSRRFRRTAMGIAALVAFLVVATVAIVMVTREEKASVATAPQTASEVASSAVVQDPQELMRTLSPIISGCDLQTDEVSPQDFAGVEEVSHCAPDLVGIGQPEGYDGDLYVYVFPPEEQLTEDTIESLFDTLDIEITFFGPGESPEATEDNHYGVFLDNWILQYLPREIAEGIHSIFPEAQFYGEFRG